MCRSPARTARERSKEKKESGHFQMDSGRRSLQTYDIYIRNYKSDGQAGTRPRVSNGYGNARGRSGRPCSGPPNRSRAGARRGRRAGSVPRPNRRCGPYGGSLSCAPYRCTFVRRPHNGNRSNRPYVSRGNDGCGACTRRIQPVKSCLSARPSSRRLPPATSRRYAPTGGEPPRARQPRAGQPARREKQ